MPLFLLTAAAQIPDTRHARPVVLKGANIPELVDMGVNPVEVVGLTS